MDRYRNIDWLRNHIPVRGLTLVNATLETRSAVAVFRRFRPTAVAPGENVALPGGDPGVVPGVAVPAAGVSSDAYGGGEENLTMGEEELQDELDPSERARKRQRAEWSPDEENSL